LALARQGAMVRFATVGGTDMPDRYLTPLHAAGVDLHVRTLDGHTARLELQYDQDGEIVALRFEGGVEKYLAMRRLPTIFWDSDWILVGTSPHDFQRQVVEWGKAAGRMTALSTQGEFDGEWELLRELLPHLDVLFINSREVVNLRGGALRQALAAMREINPSVTCLVTCGERGAFAATGEDVWWVEACSGPVVNATGAGDTFAASWLWGVSQGMSIDVALVRAAVAANLALRKMAHSGIPGRQRLCDEMAACHLPLVKHTHYADPACQKALDDEDQLCHWSMSKSVE